MKKLIITAVAVAATASIALAATTAASNIVGYSKVTATAGQLVLVSVNFDTDGGTVNSILGDQLPGGSVVNVWKKDINSYVTSNKGRSGFAPDTAVEMGDALWISAGSGSQDVIFSGAVLSAATNSVAMSGLDATGLYYPVSTLLSSTGLTAAPGGSVLNVWNGATYVTYNKGRSGWSGDPTIDPAEGFWISSASAWTWDEPRPYTP